MNQPTEFKLVDQGLELDWYSFQPGVWYALGGDFLCDPSPGELFDYLKEQGVDITKLRVLFR